MSNFINLSPCPNFEELKVGRGFLYLLSHFDEEILLTNSKLADDSWEGIKLYLSTNQAILKSKVDLLPDKLSIRKFDLKVLKNLEKNISDDIEGLERTCVIAIHKLLVRSLRLIKYVLGDSVEQAPWRRSQQRSPSQKLYSPKWEESSRIVEIKRSPNIQTIPSDTSYSEPIFEQWDEK